MTRKKLILFVDWFTPAYKAGGPITSVRNLSLALQKEYEIYVVTSDRDLGDTKPLQNIKTNVWCDVEQFKVMYLHPEQQTSQRYSSIYEEIKPDFVHLNSLFSKKFTLLPLSTFKNITTPIYICPRGMFGEASLKIKPFKKKLFFAYAKLKGIFKNVVWHGSSEQEIKEIKGVLGDKIKFSVASNFSYLPKENEDYLNKEKDILNIICVGRISPIKNIDFILKVLHKVKSNVVCKIIGPVEDSIYFQECKDLAQKCPENIQIEFIEGISHQELDALYLSSHVFVTATKNENFGHSIIESLGHGCPIIISDKTPWKNLTLKNVGFDLPLSPEKFVEAIQYFSEMDHETFLKHRIASRKFAEEIYHADDTLAKYHRLFSIE